MGALSLSNLEKSILNSMLEPALVIDTEGSILAANHAWNNQPFHVSESVRQESLGKNFIKHFADVPLQRGISRVFQDQIGVFFRKISYLDGREAYTFICRVTPIKNENSETLGALIVFYDLTNHTLLEQYYKQGIEKYRNISLFSRDLIKITDMNGNVEYESPSHHDVLGYINEANIFMKVHPDDISRLKEVYAEVGNCRDSVKVEVRKQHKDGQWMWIEAVCSPIFSEEGEVESCLIISRDISERKKMELEMEQMAFFDSLTGIYNRRKIKQIMEEVLDEARLSESGAAFLIMDLDKFKDINDNFGHDAGDAVLQEFAKRIMSCRREGDYVGRLSGDEFTVVMKGVRSRGDIYEFIKLFKDSLRPSILLPDGFTRLKIRSSVGFGIYPDHGSTTSELFKHADVALYKEKRRKSRYNVSRR
ncbi:sensor domain-containing diguanylate cyclase [Paenibacillus physcomitrellae]|uniref:Diguanylate cyclase n=1 Tax=Paenibacillus physcomitrellae TaxID=1619311 RepID=A0ABQ1FQ70_9BACL|nr:sensor domain-containing diguanylate cyclase [Paenibacillus physcomitrellae]GGA26185.1 hypothetical protein GCM10010917_08790 [Paenibacillus physcomitrellae]